MIIIFRKNTYKEDILFIYLHKFEQRKQLLIIDQFEADFIWTNLSISKLLKKTYLSVTNKSILNIYTLAELRGIKWVNDHPTFKSSSFFFLFLFKKIWITYISARSKVGDKKAPYPNGLPAHFYSYSVWVRISLSPPFLFFLFFQPNSLFFSCCLPIS